MLYIVRAFFLPHPNFLSLSQLGCSPSSPTLCRDNVCSCMDCHQTVWFKVQLHQLAAVSLGHFNSHFSIKEEMVSRSQDWI